MRIKDYIPFYKRNLQVAIPVMITQAGQVIVQLADNIMVGHLGAMQLAGVSFANAIFMLGMVFMIGFSQGITPIVGQSYGKGEHDYVSKILGNAFALNILISIILTAAMFIAGLMLGRMGQDAEILPYAKSYYMINLISIIPNMIFFTSRFFSEGIGNTKYAMWITLSVNILNIFLNWVLIYGNLGAPALGVAGAAYATLISRILAAIAFILLLLRIDEYKCYVSKIKRHFLDMSCIKSLLKLSAPISLQSLLEVGAFSFAAIMVGWLGAYQLAAHQVAQSLSHLTFMLALGVGSAATIRVSHQFGAGRYKDMRMAGKAAVHMSALLMGTCGLIFIIFHEYIPLIYTSDPNVVPIASSLIIIMSLYQVFDAVQMASISSLRGLKDITKPLIYSSVAYYLICLPSAYLLAFKFQLGAQGIWIGLLIGLAFAAVFFYIRFSRFSRKIINSMG